MKKPCCRRSVVACVVSVFAWLAHGQQVSFIDATKGVGLGGIDATRMCFADVNGDGRPDAVVRAIETGEGKRLPDRYRVFLNKALSAQPGKLAFGFEEVAVPGLPTPQGGDCLVFADIDNDGKADAVITRYIDASNAAFKMPENPARTAWLRGNGDGTFGVAQVIEEAPPKTTACIAVGDVDRDGWLDLYLGNWYTKYGESNEAFTNDLLIQRRGRGESSPSMFGRVKQSEDHYAFDEDGDPAGRPTYGAMIVPWGILELNYGRRANRLWMAPQMSFDPFAPPKHGAVSFFGGNIASVSRVDGDEDRSGKYPEWLKERGKTDARFARADEKPYRSHGNTFDGAIGDIDNDGDLDLFVTEIRHGWAGDSSDKSRFLLSRGDRDTRIPVFDSFPELSVDRIPADPTVRNWNQGDLFAELVDFDQDGRLDLLLSSGDYPDNQRLRVYRQQDDGRFVDVTAWSGLENEGSQQISLADIDLDGDMDVMVGQSFNRLGAAQIAGRTPSMKVYLNQCVEKRRERERQGLPLEGVAGNSIVLKLRGDAAKGVANDALGAVVEAEIDLDGDAATPPQKIVRQLTGIGGHAGKQHEFVVHVPLGKAKVADRITVRWAGRSVADSVMTLVPPGRVAVECTADGKAESR